MAESIIQCSLLFLQNMAIDGDFTNQEELILRYLLKRSAKWLFVDEILQSLSKMFELCILIRNTHIDARLLNWIPLFVSSDKTWHNLKQPWKTNSDRELFCHFMHQSKTYSHFYSLAKKYKFCWNLFFYRCKVK